MNRQLVEGSAARELWIRILRQSVPIFFLGCLLAAPIAAQIRIPLTVQEAIYPGIDPTPRTESPLTVGIPLPESAGIRSASELGLEGARAGQFRILGWWPNENAKWVLIDTQTNVDSKGTNSGLVLTAGHGNFGGEPLAKEYPIKIEVHTGVAEFVIRKSRFNLLDSVTVHNKQLVKPGTSQGLVLTGPAPNETVCGVCKTVYSSSNDAASKIEIEENGPVRAVVKATGAHKDIRGNVYMRFTVRMTFYAGKSYVKLTSSLRNADESSSRFNSAFKGFASYEAQVTPALSGPRTFSFGTHASPVGGAFHGAEDGYLYQAYSKSLEHGHWSHVEFTEDSSGHREQVKSYIDRKASHDRNRVSEARERRCASPANPA